MKAFLIFVDIMVGSEVEDRKRGKNDNASFAPVAGFNTTAPFARSETARSKCRKVVFLTGIVYSASPELSRASHCIFIIPDVH